MKHGVYVIWTAFKAFYPVKPPLQGLKKAAGYRGFSISASRGGKEQARRSKQLLHLDSPVMIYTGFWAFII